MTTFEELQRREIEAARAKNKPINSAHEGYSVILEELDEFWEEVRKKRSMRCKDKMVAELVQIAAMAQRTAEDVCMGRPLNAASIDVPQPFAPSSGSAITNSVEPTKLSAVKEVPCPDCYGGHFRPCNVCGDSGVALLRDESQKATGSPSAATVRFVEQWMWESPYRETWGESWSAPHVRDTARMIEAALLAMPPKAGPE